MVEPLPVSSAVEEPAPAPSAVQPCSVPHWPVPVGACDTHVHVFDPARFAFDVARSYTSGPAPVSSLRLLLAGLGMTRAVVVQPSCYGTNNTALCDALQQLGTAQARGVAVVDLDTVTLTQLRAMDAAGVRGLRLNFSVHGTPQLAQAAVLLARANAAAAPLGWHLQLFAGLSAIAALAPLLTRLDVPVVLDHFAGISPAHWHDDRRAQDTLNALLRTGRVYVKLSAPYRLCKPDDLDALTPLAQHLIALAPHRMLWASDWPHTGGSGARATDPHQLEPFRREDAGATLARLATWAPDVAQRRCILVENPGALYGFAPVPTPLLSH